MRQIYCLSHNDEKKTDEKENETKTQRTNEIKCYNQTNVVNKRENVLIRNIYEALATSFSMWQNRFA